MEAQGKDKIGAPRCGHIARGGSQRSTGSGLQAVQGFRLQRCTAVLQRPVSLLVSFRCRVERTGSAEVVASRSVLSADSAEWLQEYEDLYKSRFILDAAAMP